MLIRENPSCLPVYFSSLSDFPESDEKSVLIGKLF